MEGKKKKKKDYFSTYYGVAINLKREQRENREKCPGAESHLEAGSAPRVRGVFQLQGWLLDLLNDLSHPRTIFFP